MPTNEVALEEIRGQLAAIQHAVAAKPTPVIDPTANVLKLVEEAIKRQDDLRQAELDNQRKLAEQESKWRDKLDGERANSLSARLERESGRINALLEASTSNVALALEKQSGQALAQDRRIAVLEQNQYQTGGRDQQRDVSGQQTNVNRGQMLVIIGLIVTIAFGVAAYIFKHG